MEPDTPVETHRAGEGCARCDDETDPRALIAAVRHVRRVLNDQLDQLETNAVIANRQQARRLDGR